MVLVESEKVGSSCGKATFVELELRMYRHIAQILDVYILHLFAAESTVQYVWLADATAQQQSKLQAFRRELPSSFRAGNPEGVPKVRRHS